MKQVQMKPPQHKTTKCVLTMIKPLRIFQFLVVLVLFAITVYMVSMDPVPISALACILLNVLSGIYVFVLAVELIGQFSKGPHVFPMFAFSLLGTFLFATAGIILLSSAYIRLAVQIVTLVLCLLAATIFLIDITMMLVFWKRRCLHCRRCCSDITEIWPYSTSVKVKQDTTTSVSDMRLSRELDDISLPEHCYRKIQKPRRREYVDCPTCVPSLCNLGVAQIQTDPRDTSIVEIQTARAVTRETPMQTSTDCEFCQRPFGEEAPRCQMMCTQDPCWATYPAIFQIVRGIGRPTCCPKCKCTNEATQAQPLNPHFAKEQWQRQVPASSYEDNTLTSEGTKQVTNPVNTSDNKATKSVRMAESVTSASHRATTISRRLSKLHVDPAHMRKAETTEARGTDDEASARDRVLARGTIATIAKDEESKRNVMSVEPATERAGEKTSATLKENTRGKKIIESKYTSSISKKKAEERTEKFVHGEEEDLHDNATGIDDRLKGGGRGEEERVKVWQQFMCMVERENVAKAKQSPRSLASTQLSSVQLTPPTGRARPKILPHLKLNKVDPIDKISTLDESRTSGRPRYETSDFNPAARGDKFAELESPGKRQQERNVCSFCEQQKVLTPTSDNYRYYDVYMDKKRYLCELCAPLDCKKVIRKINVAHTKGLRCNNCGVYLQVLKTKVPLKSKTCPKCDRLQKYAVARFSM